MPFVGVCKRPYLAGYKCHASYRMKGHRIGNNGPAYYIPQNKETYDFNFVHWAREAADRSNFTSWAICSTCQFQHKQCIKGQSAASQNLFLLFPPWLVYSSIRSKRKLAAISWTRETTLSSWLLREDHSDLSPGLVSLTCQVCFHTQVSSKSKLLQTLDGLHRLGKGHIQILQCSLTRLNSYAMPLRRLLQVEAFDTRSQQQRNTVGLEGGIGGVCHGIPWGIPWKTHFQTRFYQRTPIQAGTTSCQAISPPTVVLVLAGQVHQVPHLQPVKL